MKCLLYFKKKKNQKFSLKYVLEFKFKTELSTRNWKLVLSLPGFGFNFGIGTLKVTLEEGMKKVETKRRQTIRKAFILIFEC